MNNANKPLFLTLTLALLSMTAYQTVKLLSTDQTRVLGVTTKNSAVAMVAIDSERVAPPLPYTTKTPSTQGIPCGVITTLQQQYCSNSIVPTNAPRPSLIPTGIIKASPTPTLPIKTACVCASEDKDHCSTEWFHPTCNPAITCKGVRMCEISPSKTITPTSTPSSTTTPVTFKFTTTSRTLSCKVNSLDCQLLTGVMIYNNTGKYMGNISIQTSSYPGDQTGLNMQGKWVPQVTISTMQNPNMTTNLFTSTYRIMPSMTVGKSMYSLTLSAKVCDTPTMTTDCKSVYATSDYFNVEVLN